MSIDWISPLRCNAGKIINIVTISDMNMKAITAQRDDGIKESFLVFGDTGRAVDKDPELYSVANKVEGHPLVEEIDRVREHGALWAGPADYNLMYTTALRNLGWTPPKEVD